MRECDQATRDDRSHGERMHVICVGKKINGIRPDLFARLLARFIPLTDNRKDDHFLDHFSTHLPHHFFPSFHLPARMKTNAARETAMRYTYINVYIRTTCAPKYIYLLAEVKWRGTGFMEMNGEVLHLRRRRRKVFPGIRFYRDVDVGTFKF